MFTWTVVFIPFVPAKYLITAFDHVLTEMLLSSFVTEGSVFSLKGPTPTAICSDGAGVLTFEHQHGGVLRGRNRTPSKSFSSENRAHTVLACRPSTVQCRHWRRHVEEKWALCGTPGWLTLFFFFLLKSRLQSHFVVVNCGVFWWWD